MSWHYWLLVSLLLAILGGLAGIAWMVWRQDRAISILRADLRSDLTAAKDQILEALRAHGDHYQGVIEYLREQVALAARQRDAHAEDAATARAERDRAQNTVRKYTSILGRKNRRELPY